jgi:glycosyltransferase involved in cell wall biosynthesis
MNAVGNMQESDARGTRAWGDEARRPDAAVIRVTIGMPVYNGAAYIEQALVAIDKQSHGNFTLIISDDASTDSTPKIIEAWAAKDARIEVIRHPHNLGPVRNFRYVLDRADTDYFMWYAQDDWVTPNYLEESLRIITVDSNCALVCANNGKVDADGTIRWRPFPNLGGMTRRQRIKALLKRPRPSWLYGLFRSHELRRAYVVTEEFNNPWAGDFFTYVQFILRDQVRGTDRAAFCKRVTSFTRSAFCPTSVLAQLRFVTRWLAFNYRVLFGSGLSLGEMASCMPWLMRYVGRVAVDAGPLRILRGLRYHRQ